VLRLEDGGDEGHEAGTAEELGNEDSGVALRLGAIDPLQCQGESMRMRASGACRVLCLCGWFDARPDGNGASEHPKQSITNAKDTSGSIHTSRHSVLRENHEPRYF
jgi:hypothetical protein